MKQLLANILGTCYNTTFISSRENEISYLEILWFLN